MAVRAITQVNEKSIPRYRKSTLITTISLQIHQESMMSLYTLSNTEDSMAANNVLCDVIKQRHLSI